MDEEPLSDEFDAAAYGIPSAAVEVEEGPPPTTLPPTESHPLQSKSTNPLRQSERCLRQRTPAVNAKADKRPLPAAAPAAAGRAATGRAPKKESPPPVRMLRSTKLQSVEPDAKRVTKRAKPAKRAKRAKIVK